MCNRRFCRAGHLLAALVAASALCALAAAAATGGDDVRPAVVAGAFYPGSAERLRQTVEEFLEEARPDLPGELRTARPRAIIVPHAGYRYSGRTAAFSYKLLEGKEKPSRVILLGPPHWVGMGGACSVPDFSAYSTPLGQVPVDEEAREQLLQSDLFHSMRLPHLREHSLEVQLPFLQVLWNEPPKIVPILVGRLNPQQHLAAAAQIARILDEDSLLIVSTDFTHYGRRFGYIPFRGTPSDQLRDKIRELDMEGVRHIESLDPAGFRDYLLRERATICGREAVSVMLELLSQSASSRAVFLKWANSGEVTGDYSDCVSYVALAVYTPAEALQGIRERMEEQQSAAATPDEPPDFTEQEKRILLQLARQALERQFAGEGAEPARGPNVNLSEMPERLRSRWGVFVTLTKKGQLRGCVGQMVSSEPLCLSIPGVALLSALKDPRFEPLTKDELDEVTIEISVLGRVRKVNEIEEIRVGRDGLIVSEGPRTGLLLPQVAEGYGWTLTEFLANTCRKAGLPPDAWRADGARIHRFAATVFSEDGLKTD